MDMNSFKEVNSLVATELIDFAKELPKIVSEKGEIQVNALIRFIRRSLQKFEKLNVANTEYLVFKLSDLPEDVHIVSPDKKKDLEIFNTKVNFIERVFPRIRNTDLFFRDGQRIISFFYHKGHRISHATHHLLDGHYENLVSYAIGKRDLRKRYTNALLVLTGIGESARSVEAEFCREATRKTKLIQGITIDDWPVVKSKEDKLKDIGKEYGFPLDTTLLVLLQKWLVFPDTVVFFYPMPRPETGQSGQGGIVWGVKFHNKPDINALWSIETYALLLCSFVDKVIQVQHQRIARQASLRSAVAAIMARNWAHIFSSQVLVRFRGDDENFTAPNELLDYIITRSEYIADVTGEIPLLWGEGFLECENDEEKSGILEELRRTLIPNKLTDAAGGKFSDISLESQGLRERIGFPFGAAVGRHAIFAILENYIRNVSKYGVLPSNTDPLEIHLCRHADDDASITVKLSSNSKIAKEANEYKAKAKEIEGHLSPPLIDETGALPPSGWGLKEMKIHACLLAGEDISALLAEGQPHYFQFDKNAAESAGEYTFYFMLRKYKPVLKFESAKEVEQFLKEPMKFPLCDFVLLGSGLTNYYNKDTWAIYPSRLAIVGKRQDESWLTNRVIFLDSANDDDLIAQLWEEFWELLRERGALEYEVVVVDYKKTIRLSNPRTKWENQVDTVAVYHRDDDSTKTAEEISEKRIPFSHQKLMMIWINEVHQKKSEHDSTYVVNDPVVVAKWKALLGAKVLLIDKRLYEQYEKRLSDETREQLKLLGVYVIPETEKIDQSLKVKSYNKHLSEFQFLSVHYGYLQENPETPLCDEANLASFPPFIFMHTARGKIEREFVDEHYWFKKIVSVGSLMSAFNEKFALEIKMRLMAVFLSPQQGGRVL
jgi:hypothetical protein